MEISNALSKCFSLFHVIYRLGHNRFTSGHRRHGNTEPLLRQFTHQINKAHALLTQKILLGYFHIIKEEFRSVLGFLSQLVEITASLKSGHAAFNNQDAKRLCTRGGVRVGSTNHQDDICLLATGDKGFRPVEEVVIPHIDSGGLDSLKVRTGARFRHRDGDNAVTGNAPLQVLLLLRLVCHIGEVRRRYIVV